MFRSSFQFVPYVECGIPGSRKENETCLAAGVKRFPTWEFPGGERREGVMQLAGAERKNRVRPAMTPRARWILRGIALVALAGLAVSSVSLVHHYGREQTSYCDLGASFNCDIVNRSVYSAVLGIPVALIGILGYLGLLGLATVYRTRPRLR